MRETFLAAVAVAVFFAAAPALADDCQLHRVTPLALKADTSGRVDVAASVGGHPLELLVDTGSDHSMLSQAATGALGLTPAFFPSSGVMMWGGARITRYVTIDALRLGRIELGHSELFVIPDNYMPPGIDGLLGADLLSRFDADFDFANGTLNLFSQDHCSGKVVYWTTESNVAVIHFERSPRFTYDPRFNPHKVIFNVNVDGEDILTGMDTGAHVTSMNLDAAESLFGLKPDSPGIVPAKGYGEGKAYRYRFKTMSFGGVTVSNPEVFLFSYEVNKMPGNGPRMLLGMDVLRQLHLYIAYGEEKLYVSAAGAH